MCAMVAGLALVDRQSRFVGVGAMVRPCTRSERVVPACIRPSAAPC